MATAAAMIGTGDGPSGACLAGALAPDAGMRCTSGLRSAGSGMTSLTSSPRTNVPAEGEIGLGVARCVGAGGALRPVVA